MNVFLLLGLFAVCLVLRMPISMSIMVGCVALCLAGGFYNMEFFISGVLNASDSFPLLAIPFFMLAGNIMCAGGIANRLVKVAETVVGHFTGGMGLITIVACFMFAAIAGSAVATIAAIGAMMIPMMIDKGYEREYSSALAACASTMGPIVPPSVLFITYGVIANVSVSTMFIAGAIPGAIMGSALAIVNYVISRKNGFKGTGRRATAKEIGAALWDAKLSLLMPVIILGFIYGGIVTPTEGATVSVIYSLIVSVFIYKEMKFRDIVPVFLNTVSGAGSIMIIVAPAIIFGRLMAMERIPQFISDFLTAQIASPVVFALFVNIVLLVVGMFMETTSSILILSPIFVPLAAKYGFSPLHFGMFMIINLTIGLCTPPVGLCCFISAKIGGVTFQSLFKYLLCFVAALLTCLLLITYIPELTLFLPRLLGYRV